MEDLDESSNLGHLDLYTDLLADDGIREQESLDELKEKYDNAQQKIFTLETELHHSRQNESKLKEALDIVQKNMAALLVTARSELQRKTQEIYDLRRKVERNSWNRRHTFLNATADDISEDIRDYQQKRKYCYRQFSDDDEIKDGLVRQNGHSHGDNKMNVYLSPMATKQKANLNSPSTSLKRRLDSDEENEKQLKRNRTDRKDYKKKSSDDISSDGISKSEHSRKKSTDKVIHGNRTTPRKSNSKQDMAKELLEKSKRKLRRTSKEIYSQICSDNKETKSRREKSSKDILDRKDRQDFVDDGRTDLDKNSLLRTAMADKENMFVSEVTGFNSVEKEKGENTKTIIEDSRKERSSKSRHHDRKSKHEKEHKFRLNTEEKRCMNSTSSDRHSKSRSRDRSKSVSPKKKRSRKSSDSPVSPKRYERDLSRSYSSQGSHSPQKNFSSPKSVVMDLREKLRAGRHFENETNKEKINKDSNAKHTFERELSIKKQHSELNEKKLVSTSISPVEQLEEQRLKAQISKDDTTEIDAENLHISQVEGTLKGDNSFRKDLGNSENVCTKNKIEMDRTLSGDQPPALDQPALMNKSNKQKDKLNVAEKCEKKLSPREKAMLFKEFSEIQRDVSDKPGSSSDKTSFWVELNDSSLALDSGSDDLHENLGTEKEEKVDIDVKDIQKCNRLPDKVKKPWNVIKKSEKAQKSEHNVCDRDGILPEKVKKESDTRDYIDNAQMKLIQEDLYKDSEMVKNLKAETMIGVRTIDIHRQNHTESYLGLSLKKSSSKKKKKKKRRHKQSESNSESECTPEKISEGSLENWRFINEIGKDDFAKECETLEVDNDRQGIHEKSHSDAGKSVEDMIESCELVSKNINSINPDKCDEFSSFESKSDFEDKDDLGSFEVQNGFKNSTNHLEDETFSPVKQMKMKSSFQKEDNVFTNENTIYNIESKNGVAIPFEKVEGSMLNKKSDDLLKSPNSGLSDQEIEIHKRKELTSDTNERTYDDNDDADNVHYESQDMCVSNEDHNNTEKESSDENKSSCEEGEITQSDESFHGSDSEMKLSDNSGSCELNIHLTETETLEFQYESPCKKAPVKDKHELSSRRDKNKPCIKSKEKEKDTSSSRRKIFSRSRTRSTSREKEKYKKLAEKKRELGKRGRSRSPEKINDSLRISSRKSDKSHKLPGDRCRHEQEKKDVERHTTHTREQKDMDKRDKEKSNEKSGRDRSERHSIDKRERYKRHSRDSRERDYNSTRRKENESSKNKTRVEDHDKKSKKEKGIIKDRLGNKKMDNNCEKLEVDKNDDLKSTQVETCDRKFDGFEHQHVRKSDFDTNLNSKTRSVFSYFDVDLSSITEDKFDENKKKKEKSDVVDVFVMEMGNMEKVSEEGSAVSYTDNNHKSYREDKNDNQRCKDRSENVDEEKYGMFEADIEENNVQMEKISEGQNGDKNELEMHQEANEKIENCKGYKREENVCSSIKGDENEINVNRTRLEDDLILSSDFESNSEGEEREEGDVAKNVKNQNDTCEKIDQSKAAVDNVIDQNQFSKGTTNMINASLNSDLDNFDEHNIPVCESKSKTKILNENESCLVKEEKIGTNKNIKTPTKENKFNMYNDVSDAVLDLFSSSPVSSIECNSPVKQRLQQFSGENVRKLDMTASKIKPSNLTPKTEETCVSDSSIVIDEDELEFTLCNDYKTLDSSVKNDGATIFWKETGKTTCSSGKDVRSEIDINVSSRELEIEKSPVLKGKSTNSNVDSSLAEIENRDKDLVELNSTVMKVVNISLNQECEEEGQADMALTNKTAETVTSDIDLSSHVNMKNKSDDINIENCCDNDNVQIEPFVVPVSKDSPSITLEDGEITESEEDDDGTGALGTDSLDDVDLQELINLRKKLLAESGVERSEKTGQNIKKRVRPEKEKHSSDRPDKKHHNSDESRKRHHSGSSRSDSPRSMDRRKFGINEGFLKRDVHTSSSKSSGSNSRHLKDKIHRLESDDRQTEKPHRSDSNRHSTSSKMSERTPSGEKRKHLIVPSRMTKVLASDSKLDAKEKLKDVKKYDLTSKSERDRKGSPRRESIYEREKEAKSSEFEHEKVCPSDINMYKVSENRTGESRSRHLERDMKKEDKRQRRKSDGDSKKKIKDAKNESRNESYESRKIKDNICSKGNEKFAAERSSETSNMKCKKHPEDMKTKYILEDKVIKSSEIKSNHKSSTPDRCKNKTKDDEKS